VIEVDEAFLENIQLRCEQGSKPVTRLSIQIFNSVFNENQISGDSKNLQRKYIIFDPEVMKKFLDIYLEKIPIILLKVDYLFMLIKAFKRKILFGLKIHKNSFRILEKPERKQNDQVYLHVHVQGQFFIHHQPSNPQKIPPPNR
jgi:hypothetical protein